MTKTIDACSHCRIRYEHGAPGTSSTPGFIPGEQLNLCAACEALAQKGGRVPWAIARSIVARGGEVWQKGSQYWRCYSVNGYGEFVCRRYSNSPAFQGCNAHSDAWEVTDFGSGPLLYAGLPDVLGR